MIESKITTTTDRPRLLLSTELGKRIVRTAGDCDVDQLLACLGPYDPGRWFRRG